MNKIKKCIVSIFLILVTQVEIQISMSRCIAFHIGHILLMPIIVGFGCAVLGVHEVPVKREHASSVH